MSPLPPRSAPINDGGLGQTLWHYPDVQHEKLWGGDVYRAQAAVHCVLVERLADGEGDDGGSDAGGRLDGQALSLLTDFHRGARSRCHCNLPQQNVHTCWAQKHKLQMSQKKKFRWFEHLKSAFCSGSKFNIHLSLCCKSRGRQTATLHTVSIHSQVSSSQLELQLAKLSVHQNVNVWIISNFGLIPR